MNSVYKLDNPLRGDIQGLRALAVIAVIVFHINKNWLPGGYIGVDVFFVISGFIISSIILRKKQNGIFSFQDFYIGRIRRIVPAYLFFIATVSLCVSVLFTSSDFEFYKKSLISALCFVSNSYFANFGDYFAPSAYELPLSHT